MQINKFMMICIKEIYESLEIVFITIYLCKI